MKSIFTDKLTKPAETDLKMALRETFDIWRIFSTHAKNLCQEATEEWNFSDKFGWSFRIKDKKRILIYLLPRDKFFKTAFVFGQKTTDEILKSDISENIKNEIKAAKVYAEGRGIRIEIKNKSIIQDIEKLIKIKICY